MIVSALRQIFRKQATKHELSAKDAYISDAIWVVFAIVYFIFMD